MAGQNGGTGSPGALTPHEAAIGMGSNLGPSRALLQEAWEALGREPGIEPMALSSPYRSQPVGMESSRWFINAVALIRTTLSPVALLERLLDLEIQFGRFRDPAVTGPQDRFLDLDLLLYDHLTLTTRQLHLPHPRLGQRLFVLEPLAEIAGDRVHPLTGKTLGQMRNELKKNVINQDVVKVSWEG